MMKDALSSLSFYRFSHFLNCRTKRILYYKYKNTFVHPVPQHISDSKNMSILCSKIWQMFHAKHFLLLNFHKLFCINESQLWTIYCQNWLPLTFRVSRFVFIIFFDVDFCSNSLIFSQLLKLFFAWFIRHIKNILWRCIFHQRLQDF